MLTVNALVAADSVLIPMQCEYYALEGLTALLDTVEQIRVAANPQLSIEGVLRTMFDPRNNLANEVSAQLITHFGDKVFRTVIPRNIRLAEAPSFGKPALFHDSESRGALAYLALAGEMIRREDEAFAARAREALAKDSAFAAALAEDSPPVAVTARAEAAAGALQRPMRRPRRRRRANGAPEAAHEPAPEAMPQGTQSHAAESHETQPPPAESHAYGEEHGNGVDDDAAHHEPLGEASTGQEIGEDTRR